ncbi:MAG: efflux RND transporter permease subunit [Sphaerochaetaceae bacterium]|nr:efflux RND transporter permease subunit [Sphaerochaetaceae bacterium]
MRVSHYAVKHPVVIAMLLIALVAFGVYCLVGLSMEFIPDISMPEVEVLTIYPGASAEDVENDITKILEDELVTLPNFKSMSSQSQNSLSWITINYRDGIDVYEQLTELRFRLQQLESRLPESANKPYALVGGATMLPVMQFAVMGGEDTSRITQYIADTLKPKLTRIDGVAQVELFGDVEPQISVKLRMDDVASKGISVLAVYQVLNYSNFTIPLGQADYQSHTINAKYNGTVGSLQELEDLPVGMGGDGVIVTLKDVADISCAYPEASTYVISEGSNLVMVSVTKRAGANTVEINRSVKEILDRLEEDTDGALTYKIFSDDSKSIRESLSNVLSSGVTGIIIAVIVIFLFLNNPRATLVIGSSIPLSFLFTFIAMKLTGQTINLMTTASFVVALGMVVDASTVMLEQISRYLGNPKYKPEDAILLGADEVGSSIIASAMTTMVVFIPIIFLNGMVGMILNGFALVLVLCIAASLIVSVVVVPFLAKVLMANNPKMPRKTLFMKGVEKLEGAYRSALRWSLVRRRYVIFLPIALLLMSFVLVANLGYSFIPSVDTGEFYVNLEFPRGYDLEATKAKTLLAAELLKEDIPEAEGIAVFVGMSDAMGASDKSNHAYIYVKLAAGERRDVHTLINQAQYNLSSQIPDCFVTATNGGFDKLVSYISGGGGYKLTLVGTDLRLLYEEGERLRTFLASDPDVTTTSISTDFDELMLSIDMDQTKLNSLGVTSYEAGMVSAIIFNGVDTGNVTIGDGDRNTIHLCSDVTDGYIDVSSLGQIPISTAAGTVVTFEELGELGISSTVSGISHTDRALSVSVGATLVSEDASGVASRMANYIAEHPLAEGIDTKSSGIIGLIEDSIGNVIAAVVIAIFLLYTVMVIQFERFRQPLIVMVSVPFCLIGVIIVLLVFGSSITLMSVVALVALAGTVVNNAIILIDYINQLRDRMRAARILAVDEDLIDMPGSGYTQESGRDQFLDRYSEEKILALSIVKGGSSRLRPILITTLTTVVGVIPMALAIGEGSELYASVGQAIAGGLLTSTLITLFIVPVIYYMGEMRAIRKKAKRMERSNG